MKKLSVQDAAIEYFRVLSWKEEALKTKEGDKDFIIPRGYDKSLEHFKKMMLPEFDGTLPSAKKTWPEQFNGVKN